jgi:lipopolysaccharide transport system ATP-binding protein
MRSLVPKIELQDLSVTFRVRRYRRVTFKEYMVRRLFRTTVNPFVDVQALSRINLEIHAGDRVGIIGHNGAGKSTLLRVLAGIYPPTRGRRIVQGALSSLFDLTLGFEHDATGWENITYRGYLQGETPRTIRTKLQSIAEFCELGNFLNMPLRYYSSGMVLRLAFAIATAIDPEILLIDEVLGVGDMAFQQKAEQRISNMVGKAKIMVLVTHDLTAIESLCNRGIWMDQGTIRQSGSMAEVIASYKGSVVASQRTAA